jgi:phosphonate transport system permease protein
MTTIPTATDAPATLRRLDAYRAELAARRLRTLLFAAATLVACLLAAVIGEVDPVRFVENFHKFPNYILSITPQLRLATLGEDFAEWYWGWEKWGRLLIDTVLIAYAGTLLGFVGGLMLCFTASSNLTARRWLVVAARRLLEVQRSVPELVYALVFVVAFGLGPFPGMLAIAIHTAGALGKLFAEVNENIDLKPVDGLYASGASWIQAMRFGVLPQVLSNYASYTLLRFEINVRGAAVLGFVGAGGIGQELLSAIRQFYLPDVSAILLMIVLTVAVIDIVTERLRHALIGMDQRA